MTLAARTALWQQLQTAGLVTGEMPAIDTTASPWYVRAMLGIAGWIGALFLLGFVVAGLEFLLKDEVAAIVMGAGCCAVAGFIFRSDRRNDFAHQFALAVSLAGQAMVVFGLAALNDDLNTTVFLLIAAFEVALVVLLRNALHRLWSTWAAVIALHFALTQAGIYGVLSAVTAIAMAWLWLHEFRWAQHGERLRPVAYGLTMSLIQLGATPFLYQWWALWQSSGTPPLFMPWMHWLNVGLLAAAFLYTVWMLLKREGASLDRPSGQAALLGAVLAALLSLYAPGLAIGLLIIALGFANGNRVLLGLGLLSLTSYLSWFYYSLHMTLLQKSAVLVITGAVLLLLRWVVRRYIGAMPAQASTHA